MKQYINWLIKGLAMGAADIVPGVSGGTLAFILGIYDRFLTALTRFNLTALNLVRRGRWGTFWQHVDGTFLLCLFSGILISIATLASAITYLLEHRPVPLWALFNGLILGALPLLLQPIRFTPKRWLLLGFGVLVAVAVSFLTPVQSSPQTWMFLIAGFIAICAMILPGISGSFLLLLMGMYAPVVAAVSDFNLVRLALFATGCIVGLLVFSRILSALLQRFHDAMLALLCGVVIGALLRIWPWQHQSAGATEWLTPGEYADIYGSSDMLLALGCVGLGIALIMLLMRVEKLLGAKPSDEVKVASSANPE